MDDGPERLDIGVVGKAHGLRGEVLVQLSTNVDDRLVPGSVLHTDRGELTVRAARPHKARQLVAFEGVADREAAEELRGLVLRVDAADEPPDDGWWAHELIGADVVDADGTARGTVTAIEANPASDLLVLDGGALVPVDFVTDVDGGTVRVDAPDGLWDL